jgi:hypothetical protein
VVVDATGDTAQHTAVDTIRALDRGVFPRAHRATELRLAIQADAIAIARVLGDARTGRILARKDDLSTRYGEGRAWEVALTRMAR